MWEIFGDICYSRYSRYRTAAPTEYGDGQDRIRMMLIVDCPLRSLTKRTNNNNLGVIIVFRIL